MVKAEKHGVNTAGAVAVLHRFEGGQHGFLVAFPDRVDVVSKAKVGSILGQGVGVESYPLDSVTSVSVRRDGIWCDLVLTGAGFVVEFRSDVNSVPIAREAIMKAKSVA